MIDPTLREALGQVASALGGANEPWWIIGSTAVALHGADPGVISDIDVLLSERDLAGLSDKLTLVDRRDSQKAQFHSDRFGVWSEPPFAVEFMAGLKQRIDGAWVKIAPQTRQAVTIDDRALYIPEKHELIAILRQFGREKDLARAASLGE